MPLGKRPLYLLLGLALLLPSAARAQEPTGAESAVAGVALDDPAAVARALQRQAAARRTSIAEELQRAQLTYEDGDFRGAQAQLLALSSRAFLNSAGFELLYRTHRALGEAAAAERVLAQGLRIYPHALRLQRLVAERRLGEGEFSDRAAALGSPYAEALRFELAALVAFRQNDWAQGLLDAERALYAFPDDGSTGRLPETVGQELRDALERVYDDLLGGNDGVARLRSRLAAVPDTALARVYGESALAARELLAADQAWVGESRQPVAGARTPEPDWLARAARLRTLTLRLFADRGGLSRWPDPLLVDLYVLDRAGHLEVATALRLGVMRPRERLRYEQTHAGAVARARAYVRDTWATEVTARLAAAQR